MERVVKLIPGWIIPVLLVFVACRKPEPPQLVFEDPSFDLNVEMNGQSMNFTPGAEDLYLFTDVHENHSGGIVFESSVHPLNEPFPSLTFRMIVAQEALEATEDVLDELTLNQHVLDIEDELEYSLSLMMPEDAGYAWSVNGEDIPGSQAVINLDEELFEIELFGESPGCDNSMTREGIGILDCIDQPGIDMLNVEFNDEDDLVIIPPSYFNEYEQIFWDISGNSYTSTGDEPLVVTDANWLFGPSIVALGQTDFFIELILIQNIFIQNPDCPFPDFEISAIADHPPLMEVIFVDENGMEFVSNLGCIEGPGQSPLAFFDFVNIEDFVANENGEPTKKVTFDANIELYPIMGLPGESITFSAQGGSFAFAYLE